MGNLNLEANWQNLKMVTITFYCIFFQISSYNYIKILLEKLNNNFVCKNDEEIIMKPKLKAQVTKLPNTSKYDKGN